MISVNVTSGIIEVVSPYHEEFVSFARMRKAIWNKEKGAWLFDPRDEFAVRSTLIEIYGTDDYENCDKVDVRLTLKGIEHPSGLLVMFGRELARRHYRDSYVKLGHKVAVIEGGFPGSGGSRNTPQIEAYPGTVLEIRDLPKAIVEREWLEHRNNIEILGGLDRGQLIKEQGQLHKRLEEIDRLLEALDQEVDQDAIPDLEDDIDDPPEACGGETTN